MLRHLAQALRRADWPLFLVVFFLVIIGVVGIYSIEVTADQPDYSLVIRQVVFFALGLILMLGAMVIDYRTIRGWSWILYGLAATMLTGVLLFGSTIRGTKGWFLIYGDFGFQPVELVKIIIIVLLAKLYYDWRGEVQTVKQLFIAGGLVGGLVVLVLVQPDFGSAFIMMALLIGTLLVVKMKRSYLIWMLIAILLLGVITWQFVLRDYQKERIITFLNPDLDPYGSGYNIKQSIIAVGSGNFFGRGLALGPQSRLNFLPVQETDFIFAVIAEQLGLIGVALLITLFTILVYRMIRIARRARDDFGLFIIVGIVIYISAQTVMNIGMNIGLLPIAGVPLPFVSYGGSSLIASVILIGLVQSVHIHNTGTEVRGQV